MNNHLIFQVIEQMSAADIRQLKIYIKNQHGGKSKVNTLLECIIGKLKTNEVVVLDGFFDVIYPNERFNKNKIRVLGSQLLKKVEDFLVFNEVKNNSAVYANTLLDVYRKLGVDKAFKSQYLKVSKLLDEVPSSGSDIFFHQYQQSKQNYWHSIEQRRDADESIKNMFNRFETYEVSEYLKLMCFAISAQVDLDFSQNNFAQAALSAVNSGGYDDNALVQAYYSIYAAFSESDEKYYYDFQRILKVQGSTFSKQDLRVLTLLVINFTIRRYNSGDSSFLKEMFLNYKLGLENEALFSEKGLLSRWTFQNIVSIGLLLNEIKWTENFIRDFKELINSENRSTIYTYNLSKLFYKKKDFKKAILHLQDLDSKDVFEVLNAKALLLRIYYEEEEWEALTNLLSSFERFVSRQKRIGYQKKAFLNLIRFTNRLIQVRLGNQQQLLNFKKRVVKAEALADKHWLLEQLEQLF